MKRLLLPTILGFVLVACTNSAASLKSEQAYADDQVYEGYPCLDNCQDFEKGFTWAESQGIDEIINCSGASEAEIVGCKAYVTEYLIENTQYQDLVDDFNQQVKPEWDVL